MAAPSKHYTNINGAHQDVERNQYAGPIYHRTSVSDVALSKNGSAAQYRDSRPMQSVQVVIPTPHHSSIAALSNATPLGVEHHSVSAAPPVDYQLLLLSLAEDYFAAAYNGGSVQALLLRQSRVTEYQKLIATGLSCLEASLKVWTCSGNSCLSCLLTEGSTGDCNHF